MVRVVVAMAVDGMAAARAEVATAAATTAAATGGGGGGDCGDGLGEVA